jgi:small subunit ribosomal protein S21
VNNQSNYYKPDEYNGICVVKRKGEGDEDFIKRFRKKFSKSGLAKELRERMYFEKPSNKKRRKKAQSIRLLKKEEEKVQKLKERSKKFKQKERLKKKKQRGERDDQSHRR